MTLSTIDSQGGQIGLNATSGSAASGPVGQEEDRAGKTGFEPATSGVTDQHSNQLSYFPLTPSKVTHRSPLGIYKREYDASFFFLLPFFAALCLHWRYATSVDKSEQDRGTK